MSASPRDRAPRDHPRGEGPFQPRTLREFIDALRELGEVVDIEREVDPVLELGAIIRRAYDLKAPAPLFHRLASGRPGARVLGAPVGLSARAGVELCRIALSIGLPASAHGTEIVDALARSLDTDAIAPRLVARGPCQEVVMTGESVDLSELPIPLIHAADGGRYVNTFGIIAVHSPWSGWTNWSIARQMMVDGRTLAGGLSPSQHLGAIHAEWKSLGQPTPFATALGVDPLTPFFASMPLPSGVTEAEAIGGYRDQGVELVKCRTVDLQVPAEAEIVIEGFIDPDESTLEGPMGEYTGYVCAGAASSQPVWHITAITHRRDPILPVVAAGPPAEENHTVWGVAQASVALHELRAAGLPVVSCWMPFEAACQWLVVSVERDWPARGWSKRDDLAIAVAEVVFSSKAGTAIPKISVLEDDVDITDIAQVTWACSTRSHPSHDALVQEDRPMLNLPIFLSADEKANARAAKVVQNCLVSDRVRPLGKLERVSFEEGWPKDIQDRVTANWAEYGFDDASTIR